MKKNIAIICLDRSLARSTAQLVADQLKMRFLDMRDLFVFDHKPSSFKSIINQYGAKYYRSKEASIIRFASDFNNVMFNLDSDCLYKKDMLNKLKDEYLIVYMHINPTLASNIIDKEEYCCYKERTMYALSKDQLSRRIANAKESADIEINASSMSAFKASSQIQRSINKYFGL